MLWGLCSLNFTLAPLVGASGLCPHPQVSGEGAGDAVGLESSLTVNQKWSQILY